MADRIVTPDRDDLFLVRTIDAGLLAEYDAALAVYQARIRAMVDEAVAAFGHEPWVHQTIERDVLLGLTLKPKEWGQPERDAWNKAELAREVKRREDTGREPLHPYSVQHFRAQGLPIPAGWRKRVNDAYLSPPLEKKDNSEAAQKARAWVKAYAVTWTPTGTLLKAHDIGDAVFPENRLLVCFTQIFRVDGDDGLWLRNTGGDPFEKPDERWSRVKESDLLIAQGR